MSPLDVPKLEDALPHLSFCAAASEDLHYFIVIDRKALDAFSRRALDLFTGEDFEEFRAWALG